MHVTYDEEPDLKSEVLQGYKAFKYLVKKTLRGVKRRLARMDNQTRLMNLGQLAAGTYLNQKKAELMGIHIKATGFPAFSEFGYPRSVTKNIVGQLLGKDVKLLTADKSDPVTGKAYITLTGKYSPDFTAARTKAFGVLRPKEKGFTWHHHEIIGVMVLVDAVTHPHAGGLKHIGGVFFWELMTGRNYPKK